jgi:hypothetical protein
MINIKSKDKHMFRTAISLFFICHESYINKVRIRCKNLLPYTISGVLNCRRLRHQSLQTIFWTSRVLSYAAHGGSRILRNVGTHLRSYKTSYLKGQYSHSYFELRAQPIQLRLFPYVSSIPYLSWLFAFTPLEALSISYELLVDSTTYRE